MSTALHDVQRVAMSPLDLIGNTPCVDVSCLSPNPAVRIIAKLEGQNPWGSVKDRIAAKMIALAEASGALRPGQTILEPTSGNTGIALAAIARLKGYPVKIVMPESMSAERRQLLQLFGAELILTPGDQGTNGAVRHADQLAADNPDWCYIYQFGNEGNPLAHYEGTGPEVLRDVPDVTHFVAGLGTGGTVLGVGRYLNECAPHVQVYAVDPPVGDPVQGLRNLSEGFVPPVYERWNGDSVVDHKRSVGQADAIRWTRELLQRTGIFAGQSTGAILAGAVGLAETLDSGTVVFIACDGGWKYLSTSTYANPAVLPVGS